MDSSIQREVESILQSTNPDLFPHQQKDLWSQRLQEIKNRGDTPWYVDVEIDQFYQQFLSAYESGKTAQQALSSITGGMSSRFSPVSPSRTVDQNAIEFNNILSDLRKKARDLAKEVRVNEGLLPLKRVELKQYYDQVRPTISPKYVGAFDAEYRALSDFGLQRNWGNVDFMMLDTWERLAGASANLVVGVVNQSTPEKDVMVDANLPTWPFYGLRSYSSSATRLTPSEKENLARLRLITDVILTTASVLPDGQIQTSDEPQPASEEPYVMDLITVSTLQNYGNLLFHYFGDDASASLSRERLNDIGVPALGNPAATKTILLAFDILKAVSLSYRSSQVRDAIAQSESIAQGNDQCSSALDSEISTFKELHPEYADLSDDEIRSLICSTQSLGANDAFPAPEIAFDTLRLGRLMDAQILTSLHANLELVGSNPTPEAVFAAIGRSVAQPFINQIPNVQTGLDQDQLANDALNESIAGGLTLLGADNPDLHPALGLVADQVSSIHFPEFTARLGEHLEEPVTLENDPQGSMVDGLIGGVGVGFDIGKRFGTGVVMGQVAARSLEQRGPEQAQSVLTAMSPFIADGARKIVAIQNSVPEKVEIDGLTDDEVARLQQEYVDENPARTPLIAAELGSSLALLGGFFLGLADGIERQKKTRRADHDRKPPEGAGRASFDQGVAYFDAIEKSRRRPVAGPSVGGNQFGISIPQQRAPDVSVGWGATTAGEGGIKGVFKVEF